MLSCPGELCHCRACAKAAQGEELQWGWPAALRDGSRAAAHSPLQRDGNSCHRAAAVQMKVKESRTVVPPVISLGSQMHQQMALMKEGQLQRQE